MSLFDQDGNNAFFDPEDPRGMQLSETAYHFLGGLIKHAYNFTAVTNPTVNSYKRLVLDMKHLFISLGQVATVLHWYVCQHHVVWELV